MTTWRDISIEGLGPVSRIVALYQIGPPLELLPFASFKVQIIERKAGDFLAVTNVALRDPDGNPDWVGGLGSSADAALEEVLREFATGIKEARRALDESDFEWADPHDF